MDIEQRTTGELSEQAAQLIASFDPKTDEDWVWLAIQLARQPHDALFCYEQALALNPANEQVKAGLEWAKGEVAAIEKAEEEVKEVKQALQQGIEAAEAGQKEQAEQYLFRVIELDPDNEQAWLWRGEVAEDLDDALACFEKVLAINPQNDIARARMKEVEARKQEEAKQALQQGIEAAEGGQKEQARQLLARVVELDPDNEEAWLWRGEIAEDLDDALACFEEVLAINPRSTVAATRIREVETQKALEDARQRGKLTYCKTCGKEVSKIAPTCPYCGETIPGLRVKCPRCGSMSISIGQKGFDMGKAIAGLFMAGPLGLLAGMWDRKDAEWGCQRCGHRWKTKPNDFA